eukprot:scpid97419/ scgid35333/ 
MNELYQCFDLQAQLTIPTPSQHCQYFPNSGSPKTPWGGQTSNEQTGLKFHSAECTFFDTTCTCASQYLAQSTAKPTTENDGERTPSSLVRQSTTGKRFRVRQAKCRPTDLPVQLMQSHPETSDMGTRMCSAAHDK